MAYYGTGYAQGVGQDSTPIAPSYQAGIPMAQGFNAAQGAPTQDSAASATASGADKIQTPAIGSLLKQQGGQSISETGNLANLPSWASSYITGLAGNNYSSGQLQDAYYKGAPTLNGIYNQYGGGFDPSAFKGLGDGSLMGLQNGLQSKGYGLDNIGGYYQNQSARGPVAGVQYGFDPTYGITGSIGGLSFDVLGLPTQGGPGGASANSADSINSFLSQANPYYNVGFDQATNAYKPNGWADGTYTNYTGFRSPTLAGSGFNFSGATQGQPYVDPSINPYQPTSRANGF